MCIYLPPGLAAVTNQNVIAGATLIVANSASDPNSPAQTLGFALTSQPAGAVINPTNGLITWRPLISQSGTSNRFSVVVTNSANLAVTQSFWVSVGVPEKPVFSAPALSGGVMALTISGSSGPDYIIQGATNLAPAGWQTLFTTNSPAVPFHWSDTNVSRPQFFYRALLGP